MPVQEKLPYYRMELYLRFGFKPKYMKKILTLLAFLAVFTGAAAQNFVAPSGYGKQDWRHAPLLFWRPPILGDTITNLGTTVNVDSLGAMVTLTSDSLVYRFNGRFWERFGAPGVTTNIYNSDGVLSGNRIVDANGNYLAFNRVGAPFAVFSNTNLGSMYDTVGSVFQIEPQKLFFSTLRGGTTGFKPSFNVIGSGSDDPEASTIGWTFLRQFDSQEMGELTMRPHNLSYTGVNGDTALLLDNIGGVMMPKFKNTVAEDSVLTTDQFGNVKMKMLALGANSLQAVTEVGKTTTEGLEVDASVSGAMSEVKTTAVSGNEATFKASVTGSTTIAELGASDAQSRFSLNHDVAANGFIYSAGTATLNFESPDNRINFQTGGSLGIGNGSGVLNRFSNTGTLTGSPATAANMFITRQQLTDSLSGNPRVPSWQQTLAVNAVATSTPQAPGFIATDVNGYDLRNDDGTIRFRNTANTGQAGYLQGRDGTNVTLASTQNIPLQFRSNDFVRMSINGAGRILMGSTVPTDDGSSALQVNGVIKGLSYINSGTAGNNYAFMLGDATSAFFGSYGARPISFITDGLERARINSAGRMLIGTTTDDGVNRLQVSGDVKAVGGNFNSTDGTISNILTFSGSTGMVGTFSNHALQFVSNSTPQATLTTGGNFGIGTTNPLGKLTVKGGSIELDNTSAASIYSYDRAGGAYNELRIQANPVTFYTPSDVEAMRINSSGNVGIGTTSPATKLHVDGVITGNTLTADGVNDLSLNAPSGANIVLNTSTSNAVTVDDGGRVGIGVTPTPARASLLEVGGNVWAEDAYILGTTSTPIAEFGLDGNAFIRTMSTQDLNFRTSNTTQRMAVKGSGSVQFSTGIAMPFRTVNTDYTATVNDYTLFITGSGLTVTLPTTGIQTGHMFRLVNSNQTAVSVTPAMNLDGASAGSVPTNKKYVVQWDGSVWRVVGD